MSWWSEIKELKQALVDRDAGATQVAEEKQREIDKLKRELAAVPVTVDLAKVTPTAEALALVPRNMAVENNVLPLSIDKEGMEFFAGRGILTVAMENPSDLQLIDIISSVTRKRVRSVLPIGSLQKAIQKAYGIPTPIPTPTPTPTAPVAAEKTTEKIINVPVEQLGDRELSEEELSLLPSEAITAYIARRREEVKEKAAFLEEMRRDTGVKSESSLIVPVDPRKRLLVINAMYADGLVKLAESGANSLLSRREEAVKRIQSGRALPEDLPQELRWIIDLQKKKQEEKKEQEYNICTTCGGVTIAPRKICFFCEGKTKAQNEAPKESLAKSPVIPHAETEETVVVVEDSKEAQKRARAERQVNNAKDKKHKPGKGKPNPDENE